MKRTIAPAVTKMINLAVRAAVPNARHGEPVKADADAAARELRLVKAVVRAAASDPDPHHRVKAALDRLNRLHSPGSDAARKSR